ncbi:MAG: T9SS type A sorting domain-containing protein, partial [Saprospiraceae bacterium]|nr:T9SS type A sorting domain-containing protein [Saprospiraceae bacterium]
ASIIETGIDNYTAPSGAIYTVSGIYNDTIPNAAGCDSIITIDLTLGFTGINDLQSTWVKIYPNPIENIIQFDNLEMLDSKAKIKITNSIGQVVFNSNDLESTLDVSYLPAGVYIVFIMDTKIEHVTRFVKK